MVSCTLVSACSQLGKGVLCDNGGDHFMCAKHLTMPGTMGAPWGQCGLLVRSTDLESSSPRLKYQPHRSLAA